MRRVGITAYLAVSIVLVSGCGQTERSDVADDSAAEPVDESLEYSVREGGRLLVCTTGDYRPYTYLDPETGDWSGIDIAMAESLAADLDVGLDLVQVTWADLVPTLEDGGCHIAMGGVSLTEERDEVVDFTDATVVDGKTPITRCEDAQAYQQIDDINQPGVRVITPVGGTNEQFADEHFPEAEIIRWDDNNTIFDQIVAGEADVMVTDASETRWVANEEPELCAVHPDQPFTEFENGYLLPQGDGEWAATVDAWLDGAQDDGTYARAEAEWFGSAGEDAAQTSSTG